MSKPKIVQAFEAGVDAPAPRPLKGIPADLIAFESLGLGKLPKVFANVLDDIALVETTWKPKANSARAQAEAVLAEAKNAQAAEDALAIQDLARKGPDGFDGIDAALAIDAVAIAEAELAKALRTAKAVNNASTGLTRYLSALAGSEGRDALLNAFRKAWRSGVNYEPTSTTTLGELAAMESVSGEARELVGRLTLFVEHQNSHGGMTPENTKRLRLALTENRDELPTIETLDAEREAARLESPEYLEAQAAARDLEERKAHDRKSAAASAVARHGSESGRAKNTEAAEKAPATK